MDMRIELLLIGVTDIARAREFYASIGWHVDFDREVDESTHFVQVTPPGSACSIAFGRGISDAEPGSLRGVQLVIRDAAAAHAMLTEKGVDVGPIDSQQWGTFVPFRDPDGNAFILQELPEYSPSYANRPGN